jgi:hypothetical protein
MGFDHTELTARLLEHWRLPPGLIAALRTGPSRPGHEVASDGGALPADAAAASHVDSAGEPSPEARIVALAGRIARLMADDQAEVYPQIVAAARQWRLLPEDAVDPLLQTLEKKVQQLAEVLSLKLPDGVDAVSLIVRAHAQLTDVAAAAAEELIRAGRLGGNTPSTGEPLHPTSRTLQEAVLQLSRRRLDASSASRGASDSSPAAAVATTTAAALAAPAPTAPNTPAASIASQRASLGSAADLPRGVAADRRGKAVRHTSATDPALRGRLAAAVAACRQNRCALSLLLAEIAQREDLVMSLGVQKFDHIRAALERVCREIDHPQVLCLPYGEIGFSVILADCERRQAVELGNALWERFRRLSLDRTARETTALPLGVGTSTVAMPPKNFPPDDLLTAAERCLYGSHASGGGVVKSIEIY